MDIDGTRFADSTNFAAAIAAARRFRDHVRVTHPELAEEYQRIGSRLHDELTTELAGVDPQDALRVWVACSGKALAIAVGLGVDAQLLAAATTPMLWALIPDGGS